MFNPQTHPVSPKGPRCSAQRVAIDHRNPQPPQATQPPNSPRTGLRGEGWPPGARDPIIGDRHQRTRRRDRPAQRPPIRFSDGHRARQQAAATVDREVGDRSRIRTRVAEYGDLVTSGRFRPYGLAGRPARPTAPVSVIVRWADQLARGQRRPRALRRGCGTRPSMFGLPRESFCHVRSIGSMFGRWTQTGH